MTDQNIEVPITLIKYWIDIIHNELLDAPTVGLTNIYESLIGIYGKVKYKNE